MAKIKHIIVEKRDYFREILHRIFLNLFIVPLSFGVVLFPFLFLYLMFLEIERINIFPEIWSIIIPIWLFVVMYFNHEVFGDKDFLTTREVIHVIKE